ncbi:MAG: chemotaxis protein CheB [Labilithrix sp.]|nr:chemotaxis protein CheB [Labilithrix sp.]MCW5812997.1 chemotaxis protein CheB [Labilithrix sp.]
MTIRVVVVDDSSISRMVLRRILEADGDIQVVGEATNGFEALPKILEHKPNLVTMDIDMPGPSGLETIGRVMGTSPVPILVVTAERLGPDSDVGFRAIQSGALDFMAKPSIGDEESMKMLRQHVRVLADVPVFLHMEERHDASRTMRAGPIEEPPPFSLIAIAGGTGAPKSVATILEAIPPGISAPIVIVQQMPAKFGAAFVKYLQGATALRVRTVSATPHDCMPGEVIVGEPGAHVYFPRRGVVVSREGAPYAGALPSMTVMFRSIAETYGKDAVGVLLSGTGTDGLEGLAAMREAGALTIAESPDSAPVAELPAAALASGAATRALQAQMIASSLVSAMTDVGKKTTAPPSSDPAFAAELDVRMR